MIKKLTRHGNSLALVIDKPILELLHIEPNTDISISTDGKTLTLAPLHSDSRTLRDEKLKNIREKMNKKYERTFRKLAD